MADVRLSVNQDFMDLLKSKTGVNEDTKLTTDALTLYNWAVSEVKNGRTLISVDEHGGDPRKVVTDILEKVKTSK